MHRWRHKIAKTFWCIKQIDSIFPRASVPLSGQRRCHSASREQQSHHSTYFVSIRIFCSLHAVTSSVHLLQYGRTGKWSLFIKYCYKKEIDYLTGMQVLPMIGVNLINALNYNHLSKFTLRTSTLITGSRVWPRNDHPRFHALWRHGWRFHGWRRHGW